MMLPEHMQDTILSILLVLIVMAWIILAQIGP